MCRLYAFLALEPMRVECALIRAQNSLLAQSMSDSTLAENPDGWGIAYYAGSTPQVDRRSAAAFRDLDFLARAHEIRARVVVAHVRRGTVGSASVENTHPFRLGRWIFAHNGGVPRLQEIAPLLEAEVDTDLIRERAGQTDSELLFLWILTRLRKGASGVPERSAPLGAMVGAVRAAIDRLAELCGPAGSRDLALNVVLTDGEGLVASRYHCPLYVLERSRAFACEVCRECHCHGCESGGPRADAHGPRAIVVASEAITREGWKEVPEDSIVCVTRAAELQVLRGTGAARQQ